LTLASIVEKETGLAEERPRVAAVFVNRLNRGMRLQTDPTVIYGITGGEGPLGRGLKASELAAATPYNTYVIAGLPPGPIANPGREAIAAAANPPATEDFYFVADGTGGHAFAATLEQHNANVAAWRRLEAQRALEAEEAAKAEAQEEVVGQ
ncbi:MAG: endolytic transglycosylase MltG, partial [Rhodovulum sp.]|nr:endolytic transglycosylase MltG [Rhodovulum sp.]